MTVWLTMPAAALLLLTSPAGADVGHAAAPPSSIAAPLWVWVAGFVGLTIIIALLIRQTKRGGLTLERFRGFSRNARLLVWRSPFSGFSTSLVRLLFNLYLLTLGFDALFVAKFAAINWMFHGLAVIPSGVLSDLFGRRRIFLVGYSGNLLATTAILFVTDPGWLLALAAVIGLFEGGHAIVGPPFMIEQSRPDERVHLFSLNGGIQVGAASLGNLAAGVLPLAFAALFGIGAESVWAKRAALGCAIPIMICSMIPIILIREEWAPIDIRRWVKGIESYGRIGMLALTEGLTGFAMGFSAPFFNVFFDQQLRASTAQIGLIFALGSILSAAVTLFVPVAVHYLGRVRTIALVKLLGVPALMLLGTSQSVMWAGVCYLLAILLIGGTFPNKGVSDPIYSLFAMEVVKERERGTTNGIMHAFVEFPMGIGAALAGPLMAANEWQAPYLISGLIFALAFVMYYLYFIRIEGRHPVLQAAPGAARP